MMERLFATIVVLLGLVASSSTNAASQAQAQSSFYVEVYGLAQETDTPYLERAQSIFKKMKRVAGLTTSSATMLIVNSQSKPWAMALADGNIVLSKGALDIIYSGDDTDRGDAWMSFVLGHELAHLTNRDLWHHEVHVALSGQNQNPDLTRIRQVLAESSLNLENIRERELRADESGFVFSSLAGYGTDKIFSNSATGKSFLAHWAEQTHTLLDESHHTPSQRTQFLESRFATLRDRVSLFDFGVRLAHFGRYSDALHLLDDFRLNFPSRQVLNNLAYINIQLARQAMPQRMAYRFWLPTLLETVSGLPGTRGMNDELPEAARTRLEEAVELLDSAIKLDKKNLTTSINMITALLYLGRNHHARAVLEDALALRPQSIQLQGLKALVLLEQDPQIDMWPVVSPLLEELTASEDAHDNILYNYAQLLNERGRHGKARAYWQRLKNRFSDLPTVYQELVCKNMPDPDPCFDLMEIRQVTTVEWQLPIEIGLDIGAGDTRTVLANWDRLKKQAGPLKVDIYTSPEGHTALAIDNLVEMVTLRQQPLTADKLKTLAGNPGVVMPHALGQLWSYGPSWSAVVAGAQLSEIWIAQ